MQLLSPRSASRGPPTETKRSLSNDFRMHQSNPIPVAESSSHRPAKFTQSSTQSQVQHVTWVTARAGHLAQVRRTQDMNMAPLRSQCHTGNMSGSRAVTWEQDDNVSWLSQSAQWYFGLLSRVQIALEALPGTACLWPGRE